MINKFDIKDQKLLDKVEQSITSALIAKAFVEIPFRDVDFNFYKSLHGYIFSDIYDWAGEIRTVNMSKKGTDFCNFEEIEENGNRIFNRLKNTNYLKNLQDEAFVDEFTDIFCELNYLHPFREGNGRVQRLFLSMLLSNLKKKLDFSKIDKDLFMIATIKSVTGDVFMLKDIFSSNIEFPPKSKKIQKIESAINYLHTNIFNCDLKVDDLHLLCGMSDTYFRKIFKTNFGVTPQEYIINKRLSQAQSIILSGDYNSIGEVALSVGYSDALYFSRIFSKKHGVCPSEYIRK